VLAPTRGQRLAVLDAAQLDQQEHRLLDALGPDMDRYAAAIVEGRRPTVRRRARPDIRQFLDRPVAVQL
jgi:DNA-binding ferritin-like protein (Dps family)